MRNDDRQQRRVRLQLDHEDDRQQDDATAGHPLAARQKLHLGPRKTGQISTEAAEHAALKKLVDAGEVEITDEPGGSTGPGSGGAEVTARRGSRRAAAGVGAAIADPGDRDDPTTRRPRRAILHPAARRSRPRSDGWCLALIGATVVVAAVSSSARGERERAVAPPESAPSGRGDCRRRPGSSFRKRVPSGRTRPCLLVHGTGAWSENVAPPRSPRSPPTGRARGRARSPARSATRSVRRARGTRRPIRPARHRRGPRRPAGHVVGRAWSATRSAADRRSRRRCRPPDRVGALVLVDAALSDRGGRRPDADATVGAGRAASSAFDRRSAGACVVELPHESTRSRAACSSGFVADPGTSRPTRGSPIYQRPLDGRRDDRRRRRLACRS